MIALDVNILVSALNVTMPDHEEMRDWLAMACADLEPTGVSEAVLTGAVRILTHPRVFSPPSKVAQVLDQIGVLTDHPGLRVISPGPGYLAILGRLCRETEARGNLVADAGHAATAIAHDATFVTKDRDFARFPGLRWHTPG